MSQFLTDIMTVCKLNSKHGRQMPRMLSMTIQSLPSSQVHAFACHSMPCSTHARGCSTVSLTIGLSAAGAQQSAVAVIRLSGPDAVATAQHVFVPSSRRQQSGYLQELWQPESHRVYHGRAVSPDGAVLDEVCASDIST